MHSKELISMIRKLSIAQKRNTKRAVIPLSEEVQDNSPGPVSRFEIEQLISRYSLESSAVIPMETGIESGRPRTEKRLDHPLSEVSTHKSDLNFRTASELCRMSTEAPDKDKTPYGVLHPNCKIKVVWGIVMAFLLLYTATVMPFSMAFIESSGYDTWFFIDTILDFFFFIDIIINCTSAYYNSDGKLESRRMKIIVNYMKSWMFIDILACIPFSLIDGNNDENLDGKYNNLIRLMRVPRLYRLFRITKLIKLIKHYKSLELLERIQDYLSIKQSYMRLLGSFFTIILLVHLMSCFWYFAARLEGFHYDTWVMRYDYLDKALTARYFASFYWAITTITTVGYGDISATTDLERLLACSWMIFGLYFFSFTISSLTSVVAAIDSKESALNTKLAIIDEFSVETCLDKTLRNKLKHAIRYASEKKGYSIVDKQDILSELPKKLKYEVALNMHQGAARRIPFFYKNDKSVTAGIIPLLQPLFVERDQLVYMEGEHADEVYFLISGQIFYSLEEEEYVIKSIRRGDYFGDIETIRSFPRKTNAYARRDCDLLIMNQHVIQIIKSDFRRIWDEMKQEAYCKDLEIDKTFIKINLSRKLKDELIEITQEKFDETVNDAFNKLHPEIARKKLENTLELNQRVDDLTAKMDAMLDILKNKL